jgi:hypothetical protein
MVTQIYAYTGDPRCPHTYNWPHHTPGVFVGCTCPVAGEEKDDATSNPDTQGR